MVSDPPSPTHHLHTHTHTRHKWFRLSSIFPIGTQSQMLQREQAAASSPQRILPLGPERARVPVCVHEREPGRVYSVARVCVCVLRRSDSSGRKEVKRYLVFRRLPSLRLDRAAYVTDARTRNSGHLQGRLPPHVIRRRTLAVPATAVGWMWPPLTERQPKAQLDAMRDVDFQS